MTGPPPGADQVYLGWEYALQYLDPGPPPARPAPPGPEQVNPGWVAAQYREERRLSRPATAGGALALALAVLCAALGAAGLLNAALTATGLTCGLVLAASCAWPVRRGARDLRVTLAREEQRVARARAVWNGQLAGQQEEHTRRLRDWQARRRAFGAQPQWHGVGLPAGIDRVDVAGGTLGGWSALLAMLGGLRLAAGGRVTVLDFSAGAVAQDLLAAARASGIDPLVWVLPGDLPRFDLGAGLTGPALADVLAEAATAAGDPAAATDPAQETAILERIAAVLSPVPGGSAAGAAGPSIAQLAAGLRVLAQVGEPSADVRRGLLTEAQAEAIGGLYGRAAADRVITERALALEAKLGKLASLGSAPVPLPPGGLRVVAVDRLAGRTDAQVLGSYVTAALTQLLRGEPRRGAASPPWRHTVLIAGAEQLRGDLLDRLSDACETTGTGLVLAYRSLPGHVRARLGRGNAAVAFMRLGNADDARVASEQLGTEHRFVIAQLTDTVGASVTDTAGQAYTSTVGTASSVSRVHHDQHHHRAQRGARAELDRVRRVRPAGRVGPRGAESFGRGQRRGVRRGGSQPGDGVGRADRPGDRGQQLPGPDQPAVPGVPGRAARAAAAPAERGHRQLRVGRGPAGGAGRRQSRYRRVALGDAARPGRARPGRRRWLGGRDGLASPGHWGAGAGRPAAGLRIGRARARVDANRRGHSGN